MNAEQGGRSAESNAAVPDLLAALQKSLDAARSERRSEAEARRCSQNGCPGDGRYMPPGKGHLPGCRHDAVAWVWEAVETTVIPPAVTEVANEEPDSPCASGCRPSQGDVCGGPRCT